MAKFKHGGSGSPLHRTWKSMRQRCKNPKNRAFKNYGGRGITIDPTWDSFSQFKKDMGEKPLGTSLDRIDNSKGYSKKNCRWTCRFTQNRNKRSNVWVDFKGQKKTLKDWAKELRVNYYSLRRRIVRNQWPIDIAFTEPYSPTQKKRFNCHR